MAVTQKDIADKLNLSINTVSRALRGLPDISRETRASVLQKAKELGYRKNLAASRLRTNRSHVLGVAITDYGNPVMSELIRGAESVAKRAGFTLMLGSTNENKEDEKALIESMLAQGVDGILLLPSMLNEGLLDTIEQEGVPYVLAVRKYEGRVCNMVRSDDLGASAEVAQYLCGLGHREFLYVSGLEYISSSRERYEGFCRGLAQNGLSSEHVRTIACDGSRADAYRVMRQWMEEQGGTLPATAIFAFSDYVACGIYAALREKGIRVPEDVSIVGYDNNEFSHILVPALTTVDNHFYDIGRRAMGRLLAVLLRPDGKEPKEYVNQPELVLRDSTAAPGEKQA